MTDYLNAILDTSKVFASGRGNRRLKIRNANNDELEVLLCLHQLCLANGQITSKDHGYSRLLAHKAGFYGLALSMVSNFMKTRSVALQVIFLQLYSVIFLALTKIIKINLLIF